MSASLVGSEMCIRDSLMGEVVGPRQILLMQYFLLAASKVAGLQVDVHACLGGRVQGEYRRALRRLASLPLVCCDCEGGVELR
eukprot:7980789-Alexandrium_andersonii.AAC.1